MAELYQKIGNATKWSTITEVVSKLVTPITSMILARLLTPEAFGAVATIAMIISFAELFTDAGFQKYIIQHEFSDEDDKFKSVNVAFVSNFVLSLLFWILIVVFSDQLAVIVGSPELGAGISVACLAIPLQAFSSIQMALYKRDFDFKTLFQVRIVGISLPLVVTIPLAVLFKNYWALIFGTLAVQISNAVILTIKSKWKPKLYFDIQRLKAMLAFCIWILIDSVLVWMTSYADVFFVGTILGEYYLGLYKMAITTVGQITSVIVASILPVMLPALSRAQNDHAEMRKMLLKFQKQTGIILLPLGVGIFMYRELMTQILLGQQWIEATTFIGIWGLIDVITVIFARFCSVIYPALGKPRISVIVQVLHVIVLIPLIMISVNYGFECLFWSRSLIRIQLIILNLIAAYILIRQSLVSMFINVCPEVLCSLVMAGVAYVLLGFSENLFWQFISIPICSLVYFGLLSLFKTERVLILSFLRKFKLVK